MRRTSIVENWLLCPSESFGSMTALRVVLLVGFGLVDKIVLNEKKGKCTSESRKGAMRLPEPVPPDMVGGVISRLTVISGIDLSPRQGENTGVVAIGSGRTMKRVAVKLFVRGSDLLMTITAAAPVEKKKGRVRRI